MTAAEKAEIMALLKRIESAEPELPRWVLAALLLMGGTGVFFFLSSLTEILPWPTL